MRSTRLALLLAPTLIAVLACGAARLSEITITETPATVGAIATLQRNAPDARCAYDLRESTPAVAVFRCENDLVIRFASVDGLLAYACLDATEARCQEVAAPLLGVPAAEAPAMGEQPPATPSTAQAVAPATPPTTAPSAPR